MTRMLRATWLPLSLVFAVAIAVVGLVGAFSGASAAANSVSVSQVTVAPGAQASVNVSIEAPDAKLGAWNIQVKYDTAKLTVVDCAAQDVGTNLCNKQFAADTVAVVGASANGVSGAKDLATINFTTTLAAGACSDLTVTIVQFVDASDTPTATNPSVTNGKVCVEATPTPSPTPKPATPTPVPTAAPTATPTPAAAPKTGGGPTDGSGMTPVVLAIMGLAVVSAGAWAFSRGRRETL